MSDITEYILGHKEGGMGVVQTYQQYRTHLLKYLQIIGEMDSLKGTGDWMLLTHTPGVGPAVELVDGDEPFIGSMGNAMMAEVEEAQRQLRILMNEGWGTIPLIRNHYERLMRQPFPDDYQGHEIPVQYQTIDAQLGNPSDRLLPG